jgi:hypothetical protein
MNPARAQRRSFQAIAVFEALKRLVALAELIGILILRHHHGRSVAVGLNADIVAYLAQAFWQGHTQKLQP